MAADYLAAPGEWIWSSLLTDDPAAEAPTFYKAVFGYEVFDLPRDDDAQHIGPRRRRLRACRHPYACRPAIVIRTGSTSSGSRTPAASAAQAVALGGRILVEPRADRHGGQVAVVADPQGAPIGLMEWSDQYTQDEAELK